MLIVAPSTFADWATLALLATEHLIECPSFVVEDACKRAARDFFFRSGIWRSDEQTLLTTAAGTKIYAHTADTNAELARVYVAWNGTTEVDVETPGDLYDDAPTDSSDTFKISVRNGTSLWLSPAPTSAGLVIKGSVVYIPATNAPGIPQHAFDQWGNEIAAGAAKTLVVNKDRPWTNPGMASYLKDEFDGAVVEAANQAGPARRNRTRVKSW